MESINDVEKKAYENKIIAKKELSFANELKKMAKIELRKAQGRESFAKRQLDLADVREDIAKKNRELIEHKFKSKKILKIPDQVLEHDKEFSIVNEKKAHLHRDLTNLYRQIAKLERKISDRRICTSKRKD